MIVVYTDQPLKKILHKSDASKRLVDWTIELSQFALEYWPRIAIKGQTLADFVNEYSFTEVNLRLESASTVSIVTKGQPLQASWTLYMDCRRRKFSFYDFEITNRGF